MSTKKVHGVQRLLEKLEASVNAGNYYEAHQLYRTIYFRYLTQKKYAELLSILYRGAELLLKNKEQTSGADLANLLVDVLVKAKEPPSEEHFEKLTRLFDMIGSEVPERESFLEHAIQWSTTNSTEHKAGHPQLHRNIAKVFWKEKNYVLARYHFLHSTDGSGCAMMLVELHTLKGYPSEVDLFIAQAVLQYLCLRNKATATAVFKCYTSQHPHIKEGPPYLLPLLNFIWFLLQAIESGKLAVFTVLCERYQPSLQRDPTYMSYLDKIAQIFFKLPPARPKSQGIFGDILQSFLCELDDSDSDDESRQTTSSRSQKMEMEELD